MKVLIEMSLTYLFSTASQCWNFVWDLCGMFLYKFGWFTEVILLWHVPNVAEISFFIPISLKKTVHCLDLFIVIQVLDYFVFHSYLSDIDPIIL